MRPTLRSRVYLVMHRFALLFLVACSSGSSKREAGPPPTPVETANDPWATPATASGKPGPATGNINKMVIGGDNTKPQMGLFALSSENAREVDRAMTDGLEPAYRLAEQLAYKAWAGDRNFC